MDYKYLIGVRIFEEGETAEGDKHCTLEDGVGEYERELHEVAHTMLQCIIDGYSIERIENRHRDNKHMIMIRVFDDGRGAKR